MQRQWDSARRQNRRNRSNCVSDAANVFLFFFLLAWYILGRFYPISLGIVINVVTCLLYYYDKKLSSNPMSWRIPEYTLLLYGVLGGWIGAFIAQQEFRHKTRKMWFKIVFVLSIPCSFIVIAIVIFTSIIKAND